MKIPTIGVFNCINAQQNRSSVSTNNNKTFPSFQSSATGKNVVKKNVLTDRLKNLFYHLKVGDIITIGKTLDEVQVGLKRTLILYDQVIKKIMHIKDGGWATPCAFVKDDDGEIRLINIGNKDLEVLNDSENKVIEPDESCYIAKGDILISQNRQIPVEIDDFTDIDYNDPDWIEKINPEKHATNVFDFFNLQQMVVENANRTVLAKLLQTEQKIKKPLSFAEIGGLNSVIETLKRDIVYPIKYPFAYENVDLNRGIILYGKPGTGKTMLAQALANETDANFIKICGSDLESKWVGESEKNWREMFEQAKQQQPSIIFIDEFDSVARQRGSSHDIHGDKVVNQILTLMSDIEKDNSQIFVIAASNKPDVFDDAMIRSGRFGKHIEVPAPDKDGLREILNIYLKNKKINKKLDKELLVETFAQKESTGADIKHIVNEAHINSWIRAGIYKMMEEGTLLPSDLAKVCISQEDFDKAFEKTQNMKTKNSRRPIGYGK